MKTKIIDNKAYYKIDIDTLVLCSTWHWYCKVISVVTRNRSFIKTLSKLQIRKPIFIS